jgi:large subunit ribosomal protein L25
MELKSLKASTRKVGTKGAAHGVRRNGGIPGVLYGQGGETVSLSVAGRDLDRVLHGGGGAHAILQIEFDDQPGSNSPAIVRAIQRHPLKGSVLHADFMRIRLDESIQTRVKIELTGQPKGALEGGILEHQLRELEIECLALEVPNSIVVDITGMGVGDVLHVADVVPPAGVVIITDGDQPIASVALARAAVEQAESAAEPEAAASAAKDKEGGKSS